MPISFDSLRGRSRGYVSDFFSVISYSNVYAFKWLLVSSGEVYERYIRFPYGCSVGVEYTDSGIVKAIYINGRLLS